LALRTGKTYLHEMPVLTRRPVEFFLDIEGVPDRGSYYLFGLLIRRDGRATYQAFWSDEAEDEERIWKQLLVTIEEHPEAPIYHYGQYEVRAVASLAKRYGTPWMRLAQRLVNLNAAVYGRVYFPVRSNRLKDIGRFLVQDQATSWSTARWS